MIVCPGCYQCVGFPQSRHHLPCKKEGVCCLRPLHRAEGGGVQWVPASPGLGRGDQGVPLAKARGEGLRLADGRGGKSERAAHRKDRRRLRRHAPGRLLVGHQISQQHLDGGEGDAWSWADHSTARGSSLSKQERDT